MNEITNIFVNIGDASSATSLEKLITDETGVDPTEPVAYSAFISEDTRVLSLNSAEPYNCYSARQIATRLSTCLVGRRWVNPPLDVFYSMFQPMLRAIRDNLTRRYGNAYHEEGEIESIVNQAVLDLYDEGAYLWKKIITTRSTYNILADLKKRRREDEIFSRCVAALDGDTDSYYDKYFDEDGDLYETVKKTIVDDVGEDGFEEIMHRLETKTVDSRTSRAISRAREALGSKYVPRPNRRCKKK